MLSCAVHGTIIQFSLRYKKMVEHTLLFKRRRSRSYGEEARIEFKKTVVDQRARYKKECGETIQRGMEEAAEKVAHTAQSNRQKKKSEETTG